MRAARENAERSKVIKLDFVFLLLTSSVVLQTLRRPIIRSGTNKATPARRDHPAGIYSGRWWNTYKHNNFV